MHAADPDRRLLGAVLVSLLLHGLVLLLQFGVPSLGLPGTPPLTIRIAVADDPVLPAPTPNPAPLPLPEPPVPLPAAPPASPPRQVSGMQLVDPVIAAPPPVKATPAVRKAKPRRAKRVSTPLPAQETLVEPSRVISQDSTLNDFNVPVARPEEAEEKTIDIKEAQHGEDEGDAATSAALEAAEAKAGQLKAEEAETANKLVEEAREAEKRIAEQERLRIDQETRQAEQALNKKIEEEKLAQLQKAEQETALLQKRQLAQQQSEQLKQDQLKQEQLKQEQLKEAQQRAEQQRAEQLKLDQAKTGRLKLEQQRAEQARLEQQRIEQAKLAQQQAEQQRLNQQRLEQQRLEQQEAEQQRAEQQRAEQQRAEQQRAEQQRADQQRAEQQRGDKKRAEHEAAQQRGRELAASQPGSTGQGAPAAGTGAGAGGGTVKIPKDMLGSDLGNRARDLVKGLDVLRGTPPAGRRPGDRRAVVSFNERDLPLKMYVESWRQKIERNGALNYPRSWVDEVRIDPLVSVAVRSDGSVEDVMIVTSSGRADMDEAVRRIVLVNARYSPFPPQIAQKYDVIEIRRVWRFDEALKLMEELH